MRLLLGGKPKAFEKVAGKARDVIGEELGLTDKERFAFAWIVDFPIYEKDEETGKSISNTTHFRCHKVGWMRSLVIR